MSDLDDMEMLTIDGLVVTEDEEEAPQKVPAPSNAEVARLRDEFETLKTQMRDEYTTFLARFRMKQEETPIMWAKVGPNGKLPKRSKQGDSGFDVYSAEDIIIPAGFYHVVSTELVLEVPHGWEVQVRSRSGLAGKQGVFVLNSPGTIDSTYTGGCKVILANFTCNDLTVSKGDRIAQLVYSKKDAVSLEEAPMELDEFVDHLNTKFEGEARGSNGFGSTGK